jgi:GNAT superfamily N-acetyltransferase
MATDPATAPDPGVVVRPLTRSDLPAAASRQRQELPEGFFTELGERFLGRYLETYLDGPVAVALAVESGGVTVGHLVGTVGPGHYRWALRTRWRRLLPVALLALAVRPGVAVRFVRTRAGRYSRTALKVMRAPEAADTRPARERTRVPAALLHVAVDGQARGAGAGAALVHEFEQRARRAGCRTARLVTFAGDPADGVRSGALAFYERLGWTLSGQRIDEAGRLVLVCTRDL